MWLPSLALKSFPSMPMMISPSLRPAWAAGPSGTTEVIFISSILFFGMPKVKRLV